MPVYLHVCKYRSWAEPKGFFFFRVFVGGYTHECTGQRTFQMSYYVALYLNPLKQGLSPTLELTVIFQLGGLPAGF